MALSQGYPDLSIFCNLIIGLVNLLSSLFLRLMSPSRR